MKPATRSLSTAVIAAASMYWLDPTSGRRRRAQLTDRARSFNRRFLRQLDAALRDLAHRTQGLVAHIRSALADEPVDDGRLCERVRSALGRVVSHPGAIDVKVDGGRVELEGAILAQEYRALMRTLQSMRGVGEIDDRLGVYESARGISALQGGRQRERSRFELLQENWSPAARLLTSAAGLGLVIYGVRSRSLLGILSGTAGGALLLRSSTNMPFRRLVGATGDTVQIRKTLHVNAPLELVFDTLAHHENFPHFMRNVRSVRMHADGRSHWCVAGPAGTNIEWDAETTRFEPNGYLAWRTVPHAIVRHSGSIRFRPENGGTGLEIWLSYSPPAGVLGHGVARLFGVDPKKELDEDLMRLKSYLETGKRPRDSAAHVGGAAPEHEAPEVPAAPEPLEAGQPLH